MSTNLSGNYSVSKGDTIFLEGQKVESLNVLLKGKVDIFLSPHDDDNRNTNNVLKDSFRIYSVDQNIFIGTIDLFLRGKYSLSYRAAENSSLFSYPVTGLDQFTELLHAQKEYASFSITSISSMMGQTYDALLKFEKWMETLSVLADNLSMLFWILKDKYNLTHMPSSLYLSEAQEKYQLFKSSDLLPLQFTPQFLEQEILGLTDVDYIYLDETTKSKLEYYKHIIALPLQLRKSFFSADDYISQHHFVDAAQTFDKINYNIKDAILLCEKYFKKIYLEGENCIISELINLITEVKKYNQNPEELFQLLDHLVKKITDITIAFQDDYHYDLNVDLNHLINVSNQVKVLSDSNSSEVNGSDLDELKNIPEELVDSAERIIRYSEISNEKADLLRSSLNTFISFKDKLTTDVTERSIANIITPIFFELYELVLKKVKTENNKSRLFEMFLTYGYMDERLLKTEQVLYLYKLIDKSSCNGHCTTYNIKEWLTLVHTMEKDPSTNEFDQDYFDVFREMKKKRQVSDNDKIRYNNDTDARLNFEINNMFKTNQRLCYGQINSYFPILHSDMITRDLSKSFVTRDMIDRVISKILEVDFSAFNREIFYHNPKSDIEKELISKTVAPDIILMPTFGFRGSMWQDITGRARNTPGRIILPAFTSENLEDMLIKLIGNFRWELCRTMMGMAWNDITIPSLTSEYMDYIQFYKKNKDLSEEAKDKVKTQIQRNNSQMREIFTADYEIWIKHECKGNVRLNKVARSILYKHCPFNKSIRQKLEKQPIFNDIAMPFSTARSKKAIELERRYNKLLDNNISKDIVLEENLKFYKEM
ncbi:MAG: hypothetical protein CVV02_07580 [Firmicutes bacterium HGW-Firmicutes-7]|nr:MAG: hypothetical protein CVV02_07580 [Firmicutes bacterium HGW-Firmicutes-7]